MAAFEDERRLDAATGAPSTPGYPAARRPLAPRVLRPILRVPADQFVNDPAVTDCELADLDLERTGSLKPVTRAKLAQAVRDRLRDRWGQVAEAAAFPGAANGGPVEVHLTRRTANALRRTRVPAAFLAEMTIGDLMALPGFGVGALLELLSAAEASFSSPSAGRDAAMTSIDANASRMPAKAGYPARGKPLAPALLAPILDSPVPRLVSLSGDKTLADLDIELSESLAGRSRGLAALVVKRTAATRWSELASLTPFSFLPEGCDIFDLPIGIRSRNCLGRAGVAGLREATVAELMAIENFGVATLLDILSAIDVELARRSATPAPSSGIALKFMAPSESERRQNRGIRRASDRVLAMHALYEQGATLEEVGRTHDITRERVRQLFVEAGLYVRSVGETARLKRREAAAGLHAEVVRLFNETGNAREVAHELHISQRAVEEILKANVRNYKLLRKAKESRPRYTDTELLECLQTASEQLGGVLTTADYTVFARSRRFSDGRPWPTHQTPFKRWGSWRAALAAAGLRANPPSAIAGQRIFEQGHCVDALREVERVLGHIPTAAEYDAYARKLGGAIPSVATVRNRFGGWNEALRKAFTE